MTQKKKQTLFSNPLEEFSDMVINGVKGFFHSIMEDIEKTIYEMEERLMQTIMANVMFLISIIFLSTALALLISDYLHLEKSWSLLIVGLGLLILSLYSKQKMNYNF